LSQLKTVPSSVKSVESVRFHRKDGQSDGQSGRSDAVAFSRANRPARMSLAATALGQWTVDTWKTLVVRVPSRSSAKPWLESNSEACVAERAEQVWTASDNSLDHAAHTSSSPV